MKDPVSQAAIRRVANGDHSMEAFAQLLMALVMCQTSTREDVAAIKTTVQALATNYANCPARQDATRDEHPRAGSNIRLALLCVLGLIVLLAAALGVSLPFIG